MIAPNIDQWQMPFNTTLLLDLSSPTQLTIYVNSFGLPHIFIGIFYGIQLVPQAIATSCRSVNVNMSAYSDTDSVVRSYDIRSNGDFCVFQRHSLVLWSSKKQYVASQSSIEIEFKSLAYVIAEVACLMKILNDCFVTTLSLDIWPKIQCNTIGQRMWRLAFTLLGERY